MSDEASLLDEHKLKLSLQRPSWAAVWAQDIIEDLGSSIHRLLSNLEHAANSRSDWHRPAVIGAAGPIRRHHWNVHKIPTFLHVIEDQGSNCHLVIVSAAASSPNVANQRADEPMPPLSQCYHGWPTTEFIDSQGFVRSGRQPELRAATLDDLAGSGR